VRARPARPPSMQRRNPGRGVIMATEQLALDFGRYGWDLVAHAGQSRESSSGNFRGVCRSTADGRAISRVYEAADRAWRTVPETERRAPAAFTGSTQLSPIQTATALRHRLGLGNDRPVDNMVDVLHELGCAVAAMPDNVGSITSFSCWFGCTPLVLLRVQGASRRRVRFDAAHELGHLVMHKGQDESRQAEREADEFAGALLIPAGAFDDTRLKPFSWDSVRSISDLCNVNLLPSLHRALELRLISSPVYKAAIVDSVRRGWKTLDPFDVQEPEAHAG